MKRKYESVIVLDTQGKEEGVEEMISRIGKEMEEEGAKLQQIDQIGRRHRVCIDRDRCRSAIVVLRRKLIDLTARIGLDQYEPVPRKCAGNQKGSGRSIFGRLS